MSLPWKSELIVRPGAASCRASLHPFWSQPVRVEGNDFPAALEALRQKTGGRLPREAIVEAPDETVFMTLREPQRSWQERLADAQRFLVETAGLPDLIVQIVVLPGGRTLAAGLLPGDLQAWSDALQTEGMKLKGVRLAFLESLRRMGQLPSDETGIALLRSEGVTMVHLRNRKIVNLGWERADPAAVNDVAGRLSAWALSIEAPRLRWMVVAPTAGLFERWEPAVKSVGWSLRSRRAQEVAAS